MTWSPLWNLPIVKPATLLVSVPLISLITSSYVGRLDFSGGGSGNSQEEISEEEEMRYWSQCLSDPNHKNFNPFSLNGK